MLLPQHEPGVGPVAALLPTLPTQALQHPNTDLTSREAIMQSGTEAHGSSFSSSSSSSSSSPHSPSEQQQRQRQRPQQADSLNDETRGRSSLATSPPVDMSIIAHSPSARNSASIATSINTSASRSAATTNQLPPISTRRAACTHIRLTRIYGPYKCHHCGRIPRLGWVYRCTQDFGEDLVGFQHRAEDTFTSALQRRLQHESDLRSQLPQIHEHPELRPAPNQRDGPTEAGRAQTEPSPASPQPSREAARSPELKPWMNALIRQGVYSEEQVAILKSQRQLVLERVAASAYPDPPDQAELQDVLIADPITMLPGPGSSHYSRRYRRSGGAANQLNTNNRTRTTTISPYWQRANLPRSSEDEANRAQQLAARHVTVFGPHGSYTPSDQQLQQQSELQQPSVCVYQTCSFCRPITRDRTWQCLHPSHLSTPTDQLQLPNVTTDNRPVSHPVLVQNAHYRFTHPEPIPDMMSSSMFTAGDISDYDDDDDDFDITTSGYDSSEISPDNSSEGTPTLSFFDEHRGWDTSQQWMAPAPTPPANPLRYGQPMPAPSVAYGNPLSGYGPSYPGQRRILRRASSMDPRLLRSAREVAEMADIGLIGLGLQVGASSSRARGGSEEQDLGTVDQEPQACSGTEPPQQSSNEEDNIASADETRRESNVVGASETSIIPDPDMLPTLQGQSTTEGDLSSSSSSFPAPGQLSREQSEEEVRVHGGVAVTEEAIEIGEPDVVLGPDEHGELDNVATAVAVQGAEVPQEEEGRHSGPEGHVTLFG